MNKCHLQHNITVIFWPIMLTSLLGVCVWFFQESNYVPVNSKIAYALPPPPLRAFDFFEKFWSNSPVCGQFRWSNAPPAGASKGFKYPTHQQLFKNFSMRQTVYSNVNILLNTTEISEVSESCLREVCSFRQNCRFPESPHLTGFFRRSQMLQKNSQYRSKQSRFYQVSWCIN